jgi:hypothetical protein
MQAVTTRCVSALHAVSGSRGASAPQRSSAAFVRANWLAHLPPAAQIVCRMSSPDDIPKLRMVPPESPEEIARHQKQNYFQYPCKSP